MLKIELHNRLVENKDWATLLFILCFIFVIITKSAFENKFKDFSNLFFSERYVKMYKDKSHLMTWFTFLLFIVQVFSFGFFIHYLLYYYKFIPTKYDWVSFIQIITGLSFFILSKYLIEKIIATAFDIEEITEQYNMLKVSYRNYIALLLFPATIVLFFNDQPLEIILFGILGVLLLSNLIIYLKGLKIFQKLFIGKMFYFILYLCTLEIAPYYFLYYFIVQK